jgi:sugar O-acyltransferase (sialic acid O-acetyltransferase NeuD family)
MDRLIVPHHSPNNPRAVIISWLIEDRAAVSANQVVASLESAKAVFEIEAGSDGYLRQLVSVGGDVESGDVIGVVTASSTELLPDEIRETKQVESPHSAMGGATTDGERRVTARARAIAKRLDVDIADISGTGTLNASDVERHFNTVASSARQEKKSSQASLHSPGYATQADGIKTSRLLLIGAGKGASLVLDVLSRNHSSRLIPIGLVDDDESKHGSSIMEVPVLGTIESTLERWKSGDFDSAIITVSSSNKMRSRVYQEFSAHGIPFANVIDSTSSISPSSVVGTGNIVLGFCRIGPDSIVGNDNFFSAMVNIEHHSELADHISFGPGVVLSGMVTIGDGVKFGTSIGCEPGVQIGEWSTISSGSVVTHDVPANSVLKSASIGRVRPAE